MSNWRVPPAAGAVQVNHCRNPACANFGVPAKVATIKRGRKKVHVVARDLPVPNEASCPKASCENHGNTLAQAPGAYANDRRASNHWQQRWHCRKCRSVFRVAVPGTSPPEPPAEHEDCYTLSGGSLVCSNCGEGGDLKSNAAVVEETSRFSRYLEPRPSASCPNKRCANHSQSVDDDHATNFYHRFGTTDGGSRRFRCKACKKTFSVSRSTHRQRRPEINIWLFKLLHSRVSLTKIADLLEISPSTLYDKIDFLQEQSLKFQGDRERALCGRKFDELLLSTDRQAYLCNWNRAADARNLQITGVASADVKSGYVLAMHVSYDPEPVPAVIEAAAIAAGDYDVGVAYREYARLWLEGDYAATATRSAEAREETKKRRRAKSNDEETEPPDDDDPADQQGLSWTRMLPDRGMLVHDDYSLHAHFQFLRQLLGGAERLCFYTEKEPGIRSAIMAAFCDFVIEERLEAFHVMITKELTVNRRRMLLGQGKAAFRRWLVARRADGTITNESWEDARLIRLLEAIDAPEHQWDGHLRRMEAWIRHPFPNMAEPERRVLHLTAASPDSPSSDASPKLRQRPPPDRMRIARLVDTASLHAVDRYFMQIRRELVGLERGIAVASNKRRVWYGYTSYDPSMIPKFLDIHRAYYNWIQVSEKDGLTRAQRFGLAKGKIRHQDIIYYR
jgi:transposase-like protein